VVFTLLVSVRQVLSVALSALLFGHNMSSVAVLAMAMVFCMVISRAIRPWAEQDSISNESSSAAAMQLFPSEPSVRPEATHWSGLWLRWVSNGRAGYKKFFVCAVGILALYSAYAVAQEYLSAHSFHKQIFKYPLFIIAVNHTCSALLGFGTLYMQGLPTFIPELRFTLFPAGANIIATYVQYAALYQVGFPIKTLMESVGILPVMFIGRLFGNRLPTKQDYAEALFITFMALCFMWNLNLLSLPLQTAGELVGLLLMMAVYVVSASLTCNLEDVVYQYHNLNPGQMLLGLELASGAVAWSVILINGELFQALVFITKEPQSLLCIGLLALAASAGAYTCTLTVRLFGPAVFALLTTCRQILSLAISLAMFRHGVDWKSCLCLVPVSLMALHSCIRQVGQQVPRELRRGGLQCKALHPMMNFLAAMK